MRKELFRPSTDAEARLLLLIDEFSKGAASLEGRTKLAKLDFFLRYPVYLKRALEIRQATEKVEVERDEESNIETRMIRYRYGPWDPAYFSVLGRLVGKGLIIAVPTSRGIGYKTTQRGKDLAQAIKADDEWDPALASRLALLRKYLNLSGTNLKKFVYENFPEVAGSSWGDKL